MVGRGRKREMGVRGEGCSYQLSLPPPGGSPPSMGGGVVTPPVTPPHILCTFASFHIDHNEPRKASYNNDQNPEKQQKVRTPGLYRT